MSHNSRTYTGQNKQVGLTHHQDDDDDGNRIKDLGCSRGAHLLRLLVRKQTWASTVNIMVQHIVHIIIYVYIENGFSELWRARVAYLYYIYIYTYAEGQGFRKIYISRRPSNCTISAPLLYTTIYAPTPISANFLLYLPSAERSQTSRRSMP